MQINIQILLLILGHSICSGQGYRVSGLFMEVGSHEPVPYATCFDTLSKTGTISDETGRFSLLLPKGNVYLKLSYTDYFHSYTEFYLNHDTTITFFIEPVKLDEVTIIAKEGP